MNPFISRLFASRFGQAVIVAGAYYLVAKLSLLLAFQTTNATAIWPPTGIALAAVLLLGYRIWPAIALAAFFANLDTFSALGFTPHLALAGALSTAIGHTLGMLACGFLVLHFTEGRNPFGRTGDIVRFVLFGALLGTTVSAIFGACALSVLNGRWDNSGLIWLTWWLGDAVGVLIITPLIMTWERRRKSGWTPLKITEAAGILALLFVIGSVVFGKGLDFQYMFIPLFIWTAFRFGLFEGACLILLTLCFSIWGASEGVFLYDQVTHSISLLLTQLFISIVSVMSMLLTSLLTERKRAEDERLAHIRLFESMDRVNRAIQGTNDLEQMMKDVLDEMLSIFDCDRAWLVYPCDPNAASWQVPMERTRPEYPGANALGLEIPMDAGIAEAFRTQLASNGPVKYGPGTGHPLPDDVSERFGFKSFMSVALYLKVGKPWQFGIHQCSSPRVWTPDEEKLLQEIGRRMTDSLTSLISHRDLQESEARYRRIVETANEGILMLGEDLLTTFVNRRMAEMIGYRTEEIIGRPLTDFMFEEDALDHHARMERRSRGLSEHYECRFRRKDGETVWTLASATPVFDEAHHFNGSFAMFIEITERKRAEEALSISEERFRRLAENARDIIYRMSLPDGTYEYMSPAATELSGYAPEEFYDSPQLLYKFIHPEWRGYIEEEWLKLLQGEMPTTYEFQIIHKSGEVRWVNQRNIMIRDEGGRPVAIEGIVTDITERKRAEEEVRKLNEELEQRVSDRTSELQETQGALMNIVEDLNEKTTELEAANERLRELDRLKSLFIASMSHELRTPLNSIIGFSSILHDEWLGSVNIEQKENLAIILQSGRHLLNIINDVIDVSKIEAGMIEAMVEEFDLCDLIDDAVKLIKKELEEKGLVLRVTSTSQLMFTDRRRLMQCVLNLLSNAVKFTEQGGVTVETRIVESPGATQDATVAEISVSDTGIGIKEEEVQKLFQPFVRLCSHLVSTVPGTGLGLYLSSKLAAEVLKGDILVTSEYGSGSRFTLRVPVRLS